MMMMIQGLTLSEFCDYWKAGNDQYVRDGIDPVATRTDLAHAVEALSAMLPPPDSEVLLTEQWLRDCGFVDNGDLSMELHRSVPCGVDQSWEAWLICDNFESLGDTLWSVAADMDGRSQCIIPADPATRGQLRALCVALQFKLMEPS